jgi:hypothetical protein
MSRCARHSLQDGWTRVNQEVPEYRLDIIS